MRFFISFRLLLLLLLCALSVLSIQQEEPETRGKKGKKVRTTPRNCYEAKLAKDRGSGIYDIVLSQYGYPEKMVKVYCDMDTDGGGWTVIQRRMNSSQQMDFYRTWLEYALGFGDLEEEFWLGLDHIHALTKQTSFEIRFDLWDFEGEARFANYKFFYVENKENFYALQVNEYSGTAGDSFTYHNKMKFSAKDAEYDTTSYSNCAVGQRGAWWYRNCGYSNLNGFYYGGENSPSWKGVYWYNWRGHSYSLNHTEMKIRPSTY